jgi:hypothetical protein
MRASALALIVLLAGGTSVQAQFGPAEPRAEPFGFSLGAGLHNASSTWLPYDYQIDRNRVYCEGSFAFNASLEVVGRVGGSDFVVNDVATWRSDKFADLSTDGEGYPLFFSGAVRGTLLSYGPWSIGGSFEAVRYAGLEQTIRWNFDVYQVLTVDPPIELNLALSVDYAFGGTILYAGPLLHFGYTKVDVVTHEFGPDWDVEHAVDALTIRDKGGVGGFLGWQQALGEEGWAMQLEGSAPHGGYGIAVAVFKRL